MGVVSLEHRIIVHRTKIFLSLSSLLVVATSGTGFVLGSGSAVDIPGLCWTCGGTMMVAAAANSLNQVENSHCCHNWLSAILVNC